MARTTRKDREEFIGYVRTLTDRQVLGVMEKEKQAGRKTYYHIAELEAIRRGLI